MKFGIFADAHYALKTYADRHCHDSIGKLEEAIGIFNNAGLSFVVNMGDSIDGDPDKDVELGYLQKVSDTLSNMHNPLHVVIGNHDLATLTKEEYLEYASSHNSDRYYSFDRGGFHFMILDGNFNEDGSDFSAGNFSWDRCFVPGQQLAWLKADLEVSEARPKVIFIHENLDNRLYEGALDPHVIKNHREIRTVLENAGNVAAVFQGHCHTGRYAIIKSIHYITLSALVVGPGRQNNAFAVVELNKDGGIEVEGYGRQISFSL